MKYYIKYVKILLQIDICYKNRGDIMGNLVITIGRQFGSGGRAIGKLVAEKLGISFYDKELIDIAAKESGINQEILSSYDEKPTNSFLYSLSLGAYSFENSVHGIPHIPVVDRVFAIQSQIIKDLAEKESCVIVGRCADYILRDHERCLNVFVHAPLEMRIKRAKEVYNINESNMKSYIQKKDKARAGYHGMYAETEWGDARSYDLSINSAIGNESVQRIIIAAAKEKFGL